MFDQILSLVKEHLGSNAEVSQGIPDDKVDDIHNEIASHVTNGLTNQAVEGTGAGLLSKLEGALTSGSPVASAIEGGLISSLTSKFGLSPMVTGAIAASLPGLLQKFAHKANNPNDTSLTADSITNSLSNAGSIK